MIYRVHDPEAANTLLQAMMAEHRYPRELDFRMEDDPAWKLAEWHLGEAIDREPPLIY